MKKLSKQEVKMFEVRDELQKWMNKVYGKETAPVVSVLMGEDNYQIWITSGCWNNDNLDSRMVWDPTDQAHDGELSFDYCKKDYLDQLREERDIRNNLIQKLL